MPSTLLLPTKLHVPALRIPLVDRPHLWDALDSTADTPLTVVLAPAGSGKTVTLATWVKDRVGVADTAWVSLEPAENDPVRFWLYVLEAIRIVQPSLVDTASQAVAGVGRDPAAVVAPLVHAIGQDRPRIFLVLDDYHWISDERIHRSLNFLVDHLPPAARLVVASRTTPPLNLPTRRVRGELAELGPDELRFSLTEATSLLAGLGAAVARPVVDQLLATTAGWAAGIYLAGLSLSDHPDTSGFVDELARMEAYSFDFLAGEVLERQSPELQAFLRHTSVLTQLSAELCDAVRRATGSQALLDEAESANLFLVPLDSHRRWFRYHHLFREMLRRELERAEPELVTELHRRAGSWHRDHGDVDAAIGHLVAAGDHDGAIELILANARTRFHSGQSVTVQRWIESLPASVVAAEPRLSLSMAWAMFVSGMLSGAHAFAQTAADGDQRLVIPGDDLPVGAEVRLLAALTLRAEGEFPAALAAATEACELTKDIIAPRRYVADAALGMAQLWSGQTTQARASLERALPHFPAHRDRLALAELMTLGHLAVLELEDGAYQRCRELTDRALALARERDIERCHLAAVPLAVRGRLATLAGSWEEAERALQEALALAELAGDPGPVAYAHLSWAELHHRRGAEAEARLAIRAARQVVAGHQAPGVQALIERTVAGMRHAWPGQDLTARELDLLRLLPTTMTRREMADALFISMETVKTHSRSLYRKLGVTTRPAAVATARDLGLLGDPTRGE